MAMMAPSLSRYRLWCASPNSNTVTVTPGHQAAILHLFEEACALGSRGMFGRIALHTCQGSMRMS